MGQSQHKKSVTRTDTMFSGNSRLLTCSTMRSFAFSTQEVNRLYEIPQNVIDQISRFLTIQDLLHLQQTNSRVCESFYNSLPYVVQIKKTLYEQYSGSIFTYAIKHNPDSIAYYKGFVQQEKTGIPSLDAQILSGFKKHIVYPPVLLDEIQCTGLTSTFQKSLMMKVNQTKDFHTVTELQLLNEALIYVKKNQNTQNLRQLIFDDDIKYPKLFKIIRTVVRSITNLLLLVSVIFRNLEDCDSQVPYLEFYLYNWHRYCTWMQSLDGEITPYLQLFDLACSASQMTIQQLMMRLWVKYIFTSNKLRGIFMNTLQRVRMTESRIEKFLLRDYVTFLIDYSVCESNVSQVGHSSFEYVRDLSSILNLVKNETQQLTLDPLKDLKILQYIFREVFEAQLLSTFDQYFQIIVNELQLLYEDADFKRRFERMTEEKTFLNTPQVYGMTWSQHRVHHKVQQLLSLSTETPQLQFQLSYEKIEYSKLTVFMMQYYNPLYLKIQKLAHKFISIEDNRAIRDSVVKHRLQKPMTKLQKESPKEFSALTLLSGASLAEQIREQYIKQQ